MRHPHLTWVSSMPEAVCWSFMVSHLQRRPGMQVGRATGPVGLMTEAGVCEGWDPEGKARLRGDQTGSISQPFKAFLSFSIKKIHGPSVTLFPQRIN